MAFRASDGGLVKVFNNLGSPAGIAFDGANIWVADYLAGSVSKY